MTVEAEVESPVSGNPVMRALRETGASLGSVFRNRWLRRIQLALAGSLIGDWAYATAVTVWAYGVGGAKAVGVWAAVRYILMSFTAPFAASFADRYNRKRVMIVSDLTRVGLMIGAGICVAEHTPAAPIFIMATIASMFGSVFRPATAALLPSLVDRPEELTSSNGVASTIESLAFFVGPALGAALIAATNVQTVFMVNAGTFLWSALLVLGIRPAKSLDRTPSGEDGEDHPGAIAEMFAGFAEIKRNKGLGLVLFFSCTQTIIAGASAVFMVVYAVDILSTGARGFGYINAVFGIGALLGGFAALGRASKNKLAGDLAFGTFLWSAPLLLVVAWPNVATVMISSALLGFGNPLVDVNFATAIQRLTPDRVLGRVFGAFEGSLIATMAIGAAITPFMIKGLGLRTTLAILGLTVAVPCILLIPAVRNLDRKIREPEGLPLLRTLPMFTPLGPTALDSLARKLVRVPVKAASVVVNQGDASDQFFVIESGQVSVSVDDKFIRHEGPGEYFGEIGLIFDVPRTATVSAIEDSVLYSLAREDFLDAVSSPESSNALEDTVMNRLRF